MIVGTITDRSINIWRTHFAIATCIASVRAPVCEGHRVHHAGGAGVDALTVFIVVACRLVLLLADFASATFEGVT